MVAGAYTHPQIATPSAAYAWTSLGVLMEFFPHGGLIANSDYR